jgi:hypothetical protein
MHIFDNRIALETNPADGEIEILLLTTRIFLCTCISCAGSPNTALISGMKSNIMAIMLDDRIRDCTEYATFKTYAVFGLTTLY